MHCHALSRLLRKVRWQGRQAGAEWGWGQGKTGWECSREAARVGRSSSDGAHWILSPPGAASPSSFFPWTCASEITCRGSRRPIAEQETYSGVRGFKSPFLALQSLPVPVPVPPVDTRHPFLVWQYWGGDRIELGYLSHRIKWGLLLS